MIGTAIGLIFLLIILGVVAWALKQLLALVAPYVGEPFMTIIWILIVLVMVLIVIWVAMDLLSFAGIQVKMPGFGR